MTSEGQRCQAKRSIRSHQGFVNVTCRGTIEGEIDSLGRRLVAVRWDNGVSMYVFPDEIVIDEKHGKGLVAEIPRADTQRSRF